jgi:hypothetical protein
MKINFTKVDKNKVFKEQSFKIQEKMMKYKSKLNNTISKRAPSQYVKAK